jgi:carbonic anhydrase/acetyltransferase-like protein (isoleucine patch superfamily)
MLYTLGERRVELRGAEHFIADNATLIGTVILEDLVSVWFNTVLRGDDGLIHVGERSNVQDGAVLHTDPGIDLVIGRGVTVGHQAMLHGCVVQDNSLIGIGAVVLNHARIGRNCLIAAKALITEGKEIPDNSMVVGAPGRVIRTLGESDVEALRRAADAYVQRLRVYNTSLKLERTSMQTS